MITLLLLSGAVATADTEVSASVHSRAVRGQSVRIMIEVRNPTSEPLSFPDLTNRPWLVRFETVDPDGIRRTLFSTPPDVDTEQRWMLAPNGRRRAQFEVPTSNTWSLGSASISVSVVDTSLERIRVNIVDLEPHHVDHGGRPVDQTNRAGASLLSVPIGSSTELWLSQGDRTNHLVTIPGVINAELSVSRIEQAIGRWITWTDDAGQVWAMRAQDEPFPLRLPWPAVKTCGRAATDASAQLILPLCVQSPRGDFDQLIAAVINGPGSPKTRHVSRFKPREHLTNVNSGGHVDWILVRPEALDHVQILHTSRHARPVSVSPVWRAEEDEQIMTVAWTLTDSPAVKVVMNDAAEEVLPLAGAR